jgi:hypothetical protein
LEEASFTVLFHISRSEHKHCKAITLRQVLAVVSLVEEVLWAQICSVEVQTPQLQQTMPLLRKEAVFSAPETRALVILIRQLLDKILSEAAEICLAASITRRQHRRQEAF